MIHPNTELRHVNDLIGCGVFATRFIPKGTIVWARDPLDQTFTEEQVAAMGEPFRQILDKYTFVDAEGRYVLCWDHSRFFNHSCNANCLGAGYDFELAVRDIQAGEELTDDYGTLNPRDSFECFCDSPRCRGTICPDDMQRLAGVWDLSARAAFALIPRVPQPLWRVLSEQEEVEAALRDFSLYRSVQCNYSPVT